MAQVVIKFTETTCNEGCGEEVNKGRRFKQGHDARLRSVLYKAQRAGDQVNVNGKKMSADEAIAQFEFPPPAEKKPRAKKEKAEGEEATAKA
jgi:hypothetical protein